MINQSGRKEPSVTLYTHERRKEAMKNKRTHQTLIIVISIALLLAVIPIIGHTAIPKKINYQGYLTDPQGTATDGTVSIVFFIYSQSSGGTALWTEAQTVTVTDGMFSTNLGDTTPITLPFDAPTTLASPLDQTVK